MSDHLPRSGAPIDPEGLAGAGLPATVDEARAEILALRDRVRALEATPPDPVVVVDRAGTVVRVAGWRWPDPPPIGAPLADAFHAAARPALAEMMAQRWLGVSERPLVLPSGRTVSLSVVEEDDRYRIALHDVTTHQLVEAAAEQRRRMRALADLAGSLARELTDPLSIVQGRLELLLDLGVSEPSAVRRHLEVALEHARRVGATVSNLRLVGRTVDASKESVPVREAVDEALDLLGPRRDQVLVRLDPTDLAVGCQRAVTARVLASLMRQGLESAGRSVIHLRGRRTRAQVRIRIGPNLRGGEDAVVDGDELSLERTLLASVGGGLAVRRHGTVLRFEVTLPVPPTHRVRRRGARGRVVLVGRQPLLEQVPALLERDGYRFDTARSVREAIDLLQQDDEVDAVVAELLLEGGDSGLSIARWLDQRPAGSGPRMILVYEGTLPVLPSPLSTVRWPMTRAELLDALGVLGRSRDPRQERGRSG